MRVYNEYNNNVQFITYIYKNKSHSPSHGVYVKIVFLATWWTIFFIFIKLFTRFYVICTLSETTLIVIVCKLQK